MKILILCVFVTGLTQALLAGEVQIKDQKSLFGFSYDSGDPQAAKLDKVLRESLDLLPQKLKSRAARIVSISLTQSKDYEARVDFSGQHVELSQDLLNEMNSPLEKVHPHGTAEQELVASVLHESTHVYDNILSQEQLAKKNNCLGDRNRQLPGCQAALKVDTYLSSEASFLSVAGWYGNQFRMKWREPDGYEATLPKETLAVNMEYFLLDPQFACRRPTLYRYLSQHFNHQPFTGVHCQPEETAINAESLTPESLLVTIPWERVYEVDYLLASPGQSIDSRFGHSMLRLVICAEGHSLSDACRKDISSHLVLSFRGSVNELNESMWKGISGKYPSRLFVLNLSEVINDYNGEELRDLTAYPLRLNRDQIKNVLTRAMEYHWEYQGQYYFISNNCAVEAMNLLRSALVSSDPNDALSVALLSAQSISPKGVLDDLAQMKLTDATPMSLDPQSGMFFGSYLARYQLALDKIAKASNQNLNWKDWSNSHSKSRRQIYDSVNWNQVPPTMKVTLDASFFMLEKSILRSVQTQDANGIAEDMQNTQSKSTIDALLDSRADLVNPGAFVAGPGEYGLPAAGEIQASLTKIKQLAQQQGTSVESIQSSLQKLLPSVDWSELQDLKDNVQFYLQQMQKDLKTGDKK